MSNLSTKKVKENYRNYENSYRNDTVQKFYKDQHAKQTVELVDALRLKYSSHSLFRMGMWEILEYLDHFVDDSDPDTHLSQLEHALQTAEALRLQYPDEDWLHLVGLIHDVGKIIGVTDETLKLTGLEQWAVVGDTFPVGCRFDESNILHGYFAANPDAQHQTYSSRLGIYTEKCGFDNVKMSYGHDEYMYSVCKHNRSTLPAAGLYIIRYHSFYPWHKNGGYSFLASDYDREMLTWLHKFNACDLYSKCEVPVDREQAVPYYKALIAKYFPEKLEW